MHPKQNYPLKDVTTMKIGGPAKYFYVAHSEKDLIDAINWAKAHNIQWYVIGAGSNLIPSDKGFRGLIIKNEIQDFKKAGTSVYVGAGNNLLEFILRIDKLGLEGVEKMAGIPGTVGGGIYGCVGAYGQEIKNRLAAVKIYDGKRSTWVPKKQCEFDYRTSIFKKKKHWIILGAKFKFKKGDPKKLRQTSKDIIALREKKYWPGLLCPGSFFKNIIVSDIKPAALRLKFVEKFGSDKVMYGKVPTGALLEMVGAKGITCGNIAVASHHGNLIYNPGKGKASEVKKLANILKAKVRKKFGITIEEEVQYLN